MLTKFQWILVLFIFFQIANESSTSQVEVKSNDTLLKISSKEQQLDNLFRVAEQEAQRINKLYQK